MIGFIILLAVAMAAFLIYLFVRSGAKVANVDLDEHGGNGPDVPETEAAARHRGKVMRDRRLHPNP